MACRLRQRERRSTGCSTITRSLPPSTAQDDCADDDKAEFEKEDKLVSLKKNSNLYCLPALLLSVAES